MKNEELTFKYEYYQAIDDRTDETVCTAPTLHLIKEKLTLCKEYYIYDSTPLSIDKIVYENNEMNKEHINVFEFLGS